MRNMLKNATTDELKELSSIIIERHPITERQSATLHAIFYELTERGAVKRFASAEELAEKYAEMERRFTEDGGYLPPRRAIDDPPEVPEWWDMLMEDIYEERRQQIRGRIRAVVNVGITVAAMFVLFFVNNIAALATGYDFIGSVTQWSKDALYVVFGNPDEDRVKTIDEYTVLQTVLDQQGIHVDLPTYISDGFVFDRLEPDELDESGETLYILAWFVSGDEYFSISIKRVVPTDELKFNESDGEEYTEVYPAQSGEFWITTNVNRVAAIWYQGIYEMAIQGNITYEQLIEILDSI